MTENERNLLTPGENKKSSDLINSSFSKLSFFENLDLNQIDPLELYNKNTEEQIPRMFMFGKKVGAYTLNLLGDSRYTTIDVWESRFIRSYFNDLFEKNLKNQLKLFCNIHIQALI